MADDKPPTTKPLVIRADADSRIGHGHVMRCLALAQAWQDRGGTATFASARLPVTLGERLLADGFEVVRLTADPGTPADSLQTIAHACERGATWIVVDGYDFKADYQQRLRDADLRVLFLDDNQHAEHYFADIVLNQNLHAREDMYPNRDPATQLLLGTRFSMLRREFSEWQEWNREIREKGQRVLVALGGGDVERETSLVIRALQQIKEIEIEIVAVVGSGNVCAEGLQSAVRAPHTAVRVEGQVNRMSELMAWADVAVCAGGSTCWELAFMGLPPVMLVRADNQTDIAAGLAQAGFGFDLGWFGEASLKRVPSALLRLMGDPDLRQRMAGVGRALVDGEGASRVRDSLWTEVRAQRMEV